MMRYFINSIATDRTLEHDIKELIPDMTMRRRMSRVVKMGVTTAMESLSGFDGEPDGIITATGLGCLTDSEKFLYNIIGNDEQMLNPTPFIQSTFNTIGAQVALLCKNHNYNMTYVHRGLSLESAILDAIIRLEQGVSHNVLVGAIDETTPTQERIMERMGVLKKHEIHEGATFFILSGEQRKESVAAINDIVFLEEGTTNLMLNELYGKENILFVEDICGRGFTATGEAIAEVVKITANGKQNVCLVNNFGGKNLAVIIIEAIQR